MIEIDIPGFGLLRLEHLVSDFTGTLSVDGKLMPEVKKRLITIAGSLKVHILTADTFGTAKEELGGVKCETHIFKGKALDKRKEDFVKKIGAKGVVALGNGNNDRLMLETARIGIAVCLAEGCAKDACIASDICVITPLDAIDLLINPKRLKATLCF